MNHFVILRLAIFILGLTLSVGAFFFSSKMEKDKAFLSFQAEINQLGTQMEIELGREIEVLQASRSFYEAYNNLSGDAFRVFANNAVESHPEIHSIKWVPYVLDADRIAFESQLQQETGDSSLRITENGETGKGLQIASPRDDYYPLLYMAPATKEWALGFDLASAAVVRNTLETARDNNSATASMPISIDTTGGPAAAYVIGLPIYTKKIDADEADPAAYLKGYVVGVLNVAQMFDNVKKKIETWRDVNAVSIEDVTGQIGTMTVVASHQGVNTVTEDRYVYRKSLEAIADLQWTIVGTPSQNYFDDKRTNTPLMLAVGIMLFALLIEAYLRVLQRMDRELQSAALSDSLTGVANRRRLFDHLQREWQRAKRFQRPMSFILIDVDNFKKYNDTYGHQRGDRCLHDIAQRLQAVVMRPGDLVARYGGEEFGIVLSESDLDAAMLVAEKCREAVQSLKIPHQNNADWGVVTISMGVSSLYPSEDNPDYDKLIERADNRLYISKGQGRNCATAWHEGDS